MSPLDTPRPGGAIELDARDRKAARTRVGDYGDFLDGMLDRLLSPQTTKRTMATLPTSVGSADGAGSAIHPNVTDDENWLIGLLKAWASAADVLAFYQERSMQEGYLRTATELRSVRELSKLLFVEPRPPTAGQVDLAFSAADVAGLPNHVRLARRSAVRSMPGEETPPQIFETDAELDVESAWNLLQPIPPDHSVEQEVHGDAASILLDGVATGLTPGSMVLVVGESAGQPVHALRRLVRVEARPGDDPAVTEIAWTRRLISEGNGRIDSIAIYDLRSNAHLFGNNAPMWTDQTLETKQAARPLGGGVMVRETEGFRSRNVGLSESPIQALIADSEGALFAALEGEGVRRSLDGGMTWKSVGRGLHDFDMLVLAESGTMVYAGSSAGTIYRTSDRGAVWEPLFSKTVDIRPPRRVMPRLTTPSLPRLPATAVRALAVDHRTESVEILVGTDIGLFRTDDGGSSWRADNRGLPGVDKRTGDAALRIGAVVATGVGGGQWIGTQRGVFRRSSASRRWRPINQGLPSTDPFSGRSSTDVTDLVVYLDRQGVERAVAGTAQGVYVSANGEPWQRPTTGTEVAVRVLTLRYDATTLTTEVFAGCTDGLWRSTNAGSSWDPVVLGTASAVAAVATSGDLLAVGTAFSGFDPDEWPGFRPATDHIDLDRVVPGVLADGWIALRAEALGLESVHRVLRSATVHREDFRLAETVSRAMVTPDSGLATFPLRGTDVLTTDQRLPLARHRIRIGDTGLETLRDRLIALEQPDRTVIAMSIPQTDASSTERPVVPGGDGAGSGSQTWTTTVDALLRTLEDPSAEMPINGSANALQIFANVVSATEGTTIQNEVLGSGDASLSFQRFPLGQPLAFRPGSPPTPELEIWVRGERWQRVERLTDHPASARVYRLEAEPDGQATVLFGDGVHGARVPTDLGNVVATYRTGLVAHAPAADAINQMVNQPLGLAGVINPAAVSAGTPAESADALRLRTPRQIRTLGRVVSVTDHAEFAANYPGIAKAASWHLHGSGGNDLVLCVAAEGGTPIAPGSPLLRALHAELDAVRIPGATLSIHDFQPVRLTIGGTLRIAERFAPDAVRTAVRDRIERRFGFASARFEGVITAAEVIEALQSLDAIYAVHLNTFASDRPLPEEAPPLRWRRARPLRRRGPDDAPNGAELIIVDTNSHFHIETVP